MAHPPLTQTKNLYRRSHDGDVGNNPVCAHRGDGVFPAVHLDGTSAYPDTAEQDSRGDRTRLRDVGTTR